MTPGDRNVALKLLKASKTLDDADRRLRSRISSKAMRWGLFEGWDGWRPQSLVGLINDASPSEERRQMKADYSEGLEIGRELSLRELHG